jgi:hypothetical protein
MLIWKRERVAFLHCAMRVTQCTKGGVEFARGDRHQTTHMKRFFIAYGGGVPRIYSICKSAFKKSLERTHSTNAILFGELTKKKCISVCSFSLRRMRFNIFLVCISFLSGVCVRLSMLEMVDPVNARRSHDSH